MKRPYLQHSLKNLPPSKKLTGRNFGVLNQDDFAKVSHGFLADIDLRSSRGRKMLTAYAIYCEDSGGEAGLTMAQRELIRRASTFAMLCADMEEQFLEGNYDDTLFAQYAIATRTLSTILKQIGIKPQQKIIEASLDEYLEAD